MRQGFLFNWILLKQIWNLCAWCQSGTSLHQNE